MTATVFRPGRRPRLQFLAVAKPVAARALGRLKLVARRVGRLAQPVQDASAVAVDGTHALLLGGLTANDTSTDELRTKGLL